MVSDIEKLPRQILCLWSKHSRAICCSTSGLKVYQIAVRFPGGGREEEISVLFTLAYSRLGLFLEMRVHKNNGTQSPNIPVFPETVVFEDVFHLHFLSTMFQSGLCVLRLSGRLPSESFLLTRLPIYS